MVSCLQEIDSVIRNAVDQPVHLRDPPRPAPFERVAKRFRFPCTLKRIAHDGRTMAASLLSRATQNLLPQFTSARLLNHTRS